MRISDWSSDVCSSDLRHAPGAIVTPLISGEAFLTQPGALSDAIGDAIEAATGTRPELSTSGGTSDARFLSTLCPTAEFGLVNATMHKLDEAVAVADPNRLAELYPVITTRLHGVSRHTKGRTSWMD